MRRILLSLLLLLAASPAFAVNRVAVILDGNGGTAARSIYQSIVFDFLNRTGTAYDIYHANARTWGTSGVADSTWFRQNYGAIIIPFLDGNNTANSWAIKFQNDAAAVGVQRSPLSGLWSIPTFVVYLNGTGAMSGGFDETTNLWCSGIRASAGVNGIPAIANRGTWGSKLLARFRGSSNDTLFTGQGRVGCIYQTWAGHGSVAMLAYADTTNSTGWSCTAGDSMASMWRFRPSTGPGIVYSVLPLSALSSIDGMLAEFQMMYAQTDVQPVRKIPVPVMLHNDYAGGSLNATAKVHIRAIHDTLLANGIPWTISLSQFSSSDYAGVHDADTRSELRRVLSDPRAFVTWAPGSNSSVGGGMNFYATTDTANVRQGYNSQINTATNADSFALPRSRLSVRRFVTASGLVGLPMLKVLADMGVQIVESTVAVPQAAGPTVLYGAGATGAVPYQVPFSGDNRLVYSTFTVGLTDGATFSGVRGSVTECDWVGGQVTARIDWAAQINASLYWHMNQNVTGTDGYMRWFASVIARHFRFFDRVIEPVPNNERTAVIIQ